MFLFLYKSEVSARFRIILCSQLSRTPYLRVAPSRMISDTLAIIGKKSSTLYNQHEREINISNDDKNASNVNVSKGVARF